MPKKPLPRIAAVVPGQTWLTLQVTWQAGGTSIVDVAGVIGTFRLYAPLRDDPALFGQVQVGEYGTDVVWSNEIDMAADTLWRLDQEQSGETLTAEAFHAWRLRKAYTLEGAAKALGLSRRMVAYYEQGNKPVPRTVALATRALEMAAEQVA